MLNGSARSPRVCDVQRIDLSDPQVPETRQPYHAAMGRLETDAKKISRRMDVVRRITEKSIAKLLARYRQQNFTIKRAAFVVGSQIDPRSVAIRTSARMPSKASYFAWCSSKRCTDMAFAQRFFSSAKRTTKPPWNSNNRMRTCGGRYRSFGRDAKAPWRAEQKLAAVAAWIALG